MNEELLTVKELLLKVNYNFNELYIDTFWDNIQNDVWIYINNKMLIWLGYSETDINSSKRKYLDILKDSFEEVSNYKLLNNKDFTNNAKCQNWHLENNVAKLHNKTKHLIVSPDCFRQSLMLIKTSKAKEIRKYYIELEKIFKFYLEYQNQYQQLQNHKTQEQINIKNNELDKINKNHSIMSESTILSYTGKTVIYIARIGPNLIKFGISNKIDKRIKTHQKNFELFELIYISICYNNLEIENSLKDYAKLNNRLVSKVVNGKNYTELINIDEEFTIDMIIQKVKDESHIQYDYNELQLKHHKLINEKEMLYKAYIDIQSHNKKLNEKIITLELNIKKLETNTDSIKKIENINKQLIIKNEELTNDLAVFRIANKSLINELNNITVSTISKEDIKDITKESLPETKNNIKEETKKEINDEVKPDIKEEEVKEKRKFICTRCNESFKTGINLTKHLNRINKCKDINEILEFKCHKCNHEFTCQKSLDRHLSDKRKYPCDQPKQKKTYNCEKCGKFFEKKGRYNEHLRKQTKCDMNLTCKDCGHKFTILSNYNSHINSKFSCV